MLAGSDRRPRGRLRRRVRARILAILEHARPHHVAISLDDAVRGTSLVRLFREQRRVDTAEDDPGASPPGLHTDRVPA